MEKYMLSFREIRKEDVPVAGGKGANLGEMAAAGIPVPEGGVLSAAAYDRFLRENHIDIEALLRSAASEQEASEQIRSRILSAAIPAEIEDEVRAFYRALGAGARVAVRSSATAEDLADASFAGQQETYLNVVSEEALLSKIRECYASLWSVRAIHYRAASGYGTGAVSLAVVIQQMVESESAGVLFTQNPAGDEREILINASYGLGEAVVSGLVSPDEYRCGRDGSVRNAVIGSKETKIVYGEAGTVRVPVGEEARRARVLDDPKIRALVREALRIEEHYGQPMDIEWAIRGDQVYILQARAITTLSGEQRPVFTDADFAGLPAAKPATGRMRESILFNLEKLPKPYYPLDHDFGDAVGMQKQVLFEEFGIRMDEMSPIDDNGISSFALGGMRPTGKVVKLPAVIRQMKDEAYNIRMSADELQACRESYERERRAACTTVREIGSCLQRMQKLIARTAYARFRYAIFPQVLENRSLNRTLAKIDRSLNSFDLLEGLEYVTADINRSMAALAAEIRRDPAQADAVMTLPYGQIVGKFPRLGEAFGRFMEQFGNRSDFNCYCFIAKSWNEDPDRFLHSLRTVLRGKDAGTPALEESRQKFDALMERARAALGEKKYPRFEQKVLAVRHYHTIREATQYLWESEFALCRTLLRQASSLLGARYDDLLYLFAGELFAVCETGALDEQAKALIEKRKAKRPLAEAYWDRSIRLMLDTGDAGITGVSGSNGKATGRACVVRSAEEFGKLAEGDILVCPYTDPEWTPLFTLAAGVVVDTGGTLSHAAIVAREYRIPAVLATGSATEKIRDGDTVMVDGDSGKVLIV
ncbi:MAG: phosphoenolpyruvate synthase [Oscillospiraceae bacterium]|nr:phosphoenolpyruvate synthase [Oscillospiraceae bacterium]